MKALFQKIAKLIDVKSIMTLVLTGVFAYLSVTGKIEDREFLVIYSTIVSFFFGTKIGNNNDTGKEG